MSTTEEEKAAEEARELSVKSNHADAKETRTAWIVWAQTQNNKVGDGAYETEDEAQDAIIRAQGYSPALAAENLFAVELELPDPVRPDVQARIDEAEAQAKLDKENEAAAKKAEAQAAKS